MRTVGKTAWRWLRLAAVVVAALVLSAVSLVIEACGGGPRRPNSADDAGRDAGAAVDAGRDAGAATDAGTDASHEDAATDAGEPLRDADLPDVPLE